MTTQPHVRWPCEPPYRVTQHFGENPNTGPDSLGARYGYGPDGHRAVDLVVETPPHEVLSPMRGRVRRSVSATGYGLSVTVHDPADDTTFSRLSHLSGFVALPGTLVEPGDVLGYMGRTGNVDGAHVDWELWIAGTRVDPEAYLREQEERMETERERLVAARWHVEEATRQIETTIAAARMVFDDVVRGLEQARERLVQETIPRLYEAAAERPARAEEQAE